MKKKNTIKSRTRNSLMKFFGVWKGNTEEVEKMKSLVVKDRKRFKLREFKISF
jgi:hypothetical protein